MWKAVLLCPAYLPLKTEHSVTFFLFLAQAYPDLCHDLHSSSSCKCPRGKGVPPWGSWVKRQWRCLELRDLVQPCDDAHMRSWLLQGSVVFITLGKDTNLCPSRNTRVKRAAEARIPAPAAEGASAHPLGGAQTSSVDDESLPPRNPGDLARNFEALACWAWGTEPMCVLVFRGALPGWWTSTAISFS